jgi:L-lysine 2,3-aminomutase
VLPKSVADLPDDIAGLVEVSKNLRESGIPNPYIYGTAKEEGTSEYKAYIRNAKTNIMSAIKRARP